MMMGNKLGEIRLFLYPIDLMLLMSLCCFFYNITITYSIFIIINKLDYLF